MPETRERRLGDHDLHLFNEGTHRRLYEKLGAHRGVDEAGREGTWFTVWAPNAERVSDVGSWNEWNDGTDPMSQIGHSGLWRTFTPKAGKGSVYKYRIRSRVGGYVVDHAQEAVPRGQRPRAAAAGQHAAEAELR